MSEVQRFLVKMRPGVANAALQFEAGVVPFQVQVLFASIERDLGLGLQAPARWHLLTAGSALDDLHPWDVCHALVAQGLGVAGGAAEFAEPDLPQRWVAESALDQALALTSSCASAEQNVGPEGYPGDTNKLWHRDDQHGQFDRALGALTAPTDAIRVRVAHLDTGYDPNHQSLPAHLETALQRNFVDVDRPADATDASSGPFNNLGHGTGTLSVLAGGAAMDLARLGAAPFVNVVPIRVADSVVLFYNSAIAQAFDYVHLLCAEGQAPVHVLSMSMGGLPSQAWAEAVNALYDAGVVLVTAAGNNFGNLPTHSIVYPARFKRVIAACGVMADHSAYADLPLTKMAGNYGPTSKMRTAVAAYTPNIAWAKFGCPRIARFDGGGTSAATPQVAAAAAMWIQQHKVEWDAYPQAWMRVEAVRDALFTSADAKLAEKLGRGELRAFDALQRPAPNSDLLSAEDPDSAAFPIFKTLTGPGIQAIPSAQQRMLELEALQLSQCAAIEAILPDSSVDPQTLSTLDRVRIADALANHPNASLALRKALAFAARSLGPAVAFMPKMSTRIQELHLQHATAPDIPVPTIRRLRIYAYDPSLGTELETASINEATLDVFWEPDLAPGPIGEYLEVIDVDPASRCCYAPVDLSMPQLLAIDGLAPSEANPQFHQQMVYAVAMKTIENFERALGRVALWSSRLAQSAAAGLGGATPAPTRITEQFVQRLRIYPHALRMENAFYSPERKALLLGYFATGAQTPDEMGGQTVFAALSHDIVAHETTHALLDGLHRRFREATNPDVLAFHEAFADIVALFQHFSMPESLREQIAQTRGELRQENLLAKLAVQFGQATGHYGALRDYIGEITTDKNTGEKQWTRSKPSRLQYTSATEPHARGAVLVAAAFDAFVRIYSNRALEVVKLATGGTGVLPPGAIPVQLVEALTEEASKVAGHVLTMCIRGLDYCPPVDITFGDYLRAVITADRDLVPEDVRGYRVAFIAAFRDRGIYPAEVRSLSTGSLVWEPPPMSLEKIGNVLRELSLDWDLQTQREQAWRTSRLNAGTFAKWLNDPGEVSDDELAALGLHRDATVLKALANQRGELVEGEMHGMEVHSVRPSRLVGPDGQMLSQLVVEITQTFYPIDKSIGVFRGGVTMLIDMRTRAVKYLVRKRVDQPARITQQQGFAAEWAERYEDNYFPSTSRHNEPFAILHRAF